MTGIMAFGPVRSVLAQLINAWDNEHHYGYAEGVTHTRGSAHIKGQ